MLRCNIFRSITGPYKKNPNNPILHSDAYWSGPGHCSVLTVANNGVDYFMFYHSWIAGEILNGYPRVLMMDSVYWTNDTISWPYLIGIKM